MSRRMAGPPLKARIKSAVEQLFAKAAPEECTLTLGGPGPNGALHYAVLREIGYDRLIGMKAVNIVSASFYSYLGFVAMHQSQYTRDPADGAEWDRMLRRGFRASFWRPFWYVLHGWWRKRPFFPADCLTRIFLSFVTEPFSRLRLRDLPGNPVFWTYDLDAGIFVPLSKDSPYADCTLLELARCVAAIPGFHKIYRIDGIPMMDAARSAEYSMHQGFMRARTRNHLVSNLFEQQVRDREILLKSQDFGPGRWILILDFFHIIFNLPNWRIRATHRLAFGERQTKGRPVRHHRA